MDTTTASQLVLKATNHPLIQTVLSKTNSAMAFFKALFHAAVQAPLRSTVQVGVFIIVLATPWLSSSIIRWFSKATSSDAPGPLLPRLTGCWRRFHLYQGTYLAKLAELHRQYGLVVQIGKAEYSVNDISAIPFWWNLEKVRNHPVLSLGSIC